MKNNIYQFTNWWIWEVSVKSGVFGHHPSFNDVNWEGMYKYLIGETENDSWLIVWSFEFSDNSNFFK